MRKLFFTSLMVAVAVASCKKKDEECINYGPSEMVGTYQSLSGPLMHVTNVSSNSINRSRIDDHFNATILDCGSFDVVEQTYPHPVNNYDITVSGSGKFNWPEETNGSGQLVQGEKYIQVNLTYSFNGQIAPDNSTYYEQ